MGSTGTNRDGSLRAAVYLRVSTEEQRERQTIKTQRAFADRWLAQQGITDARWYVDDGVSGTLPLSARQAGARLLDDARTGRIDVAYVYRVDRLGRDPYVTLQAATDLATAGVRLGSMSESIDNETPHGRLALVMLCGVAGYERDSLVQRSVEGSNRLAREGAWLGGIVPFGYRVDDSGRNAWLVPADEVIPGIGMSEADVVRQIYSLCADQGKSCQKIADYLNALKVPTVYIRDERKVERGKRKVGTSGVWRAGRIRNMIVSPTYRGEHSYGKRSRKEREIITRQVPALVSVDLWQRAQAALQRNQRFSKRNGKENYLLRGLITCGWCGLTYSGLHYDTKQGTKRYYRCNGHSQYRGLYGEKGQICPSAPVQGELEQIVWDDIVAFVAREQDTLEELMANREEPERRLERDRGELRRLAKMKGDLKDQEDRILGLFRRGIIDEAAVDRQLNDLRQEAAELDEAIERVAEAIAAHERQDDQRERARQAIRRLRTQLESGDGELDWETRRGIVEDAVGGIVVQPPRGDRAEPLVVVRYRFAAIATRTDRGSSPRSTQTRHNRPFQAPFSFTVSLTRQGKE